MEVYQADFRAEREAREALATDREKLRDEVRHLHQRNTQLVDELEAYQRRHFDNRYLLLLHSNFILFLRMYCMIIKKIGTFIKILFIKI